MTEKQDSIKTYLSQFLKKYPPQTPNNHMTDTEKKSSFLWRSFLTLLALGTLLCLLVLGFFLVKGVSLSERIQFENTPSHSLVTTLQNLGSFLGEDSHTLEGETDGRINILLLGRAGEHYPGKNLTDTVIILSINLDTKQVALLSLPRDLYVPIGDTTLYTKLNSVYQYGLSNEEGTDPLTKTLERITGSPIHYFITLDFDGFEKIIDTLGGISLEVPRDMRDTRYPGKNYSYETFEIKKGWQTLDGATALKYVRERHADPEGDFGRAKRQQQVIQAVKNKVFSLGTLFNIATVNRLLTTLGDSVKTDLSLEDMARLFQLSHTLDTKNVTTVVVDAWKKESLLRVSHVQSGDVSAFILVPRVGHWGEIADTSETLFKRDELTRRKRALEQESSTVTLFTTPADSKTALKIGDFLQEELGFSRVTVSPLLPLNKQEEESTIVGQAELAKPYSLDELLKRFSLHTIPTLPFDPPSGTLSDFNIVLGSDVIEAFSLSNEPLDSAQENDPSFSEPLPPQPKKKR